MKTNTLEKPEEKLEENPDGIENENHQENNPDVLEPGGKEVADEGGKDKEAGSGYQKNEEGNLIDADGNLVAEKDEKGNLIDADGNIVNEEGNILQEKSSVVDEGKNTIDLLQKQIEELKAQIQSSQKNAIPQNQELTEEQWLKLEDERGIPRSGQKYIGQAIANAAKFLMDRMETRMAKYEKENEITAMSNDPEFRDIRKYMKGINEHLSKYDPCLHSNRELLSDAYYISKGRGSNKEVMRAVNDKKTNLKVITRSRMSTPSHSLNKNKGGYKLTADEEQAYSRYSHLFKSKEEYAKSLPRYRNK